MPMRRRPNSMSSFGSSWVAAMPVTTSASDVRLQARNVRSFAYVNRGSGSFPISVSRELSSQRTTSLPELVGVGVRAGDRRQERRREHDLTEAGLRERVAETGDLLVEQRARVEFEQSDD